MSDFFKDGLPIIEKDKLVKSEMLDCSGITSCTILYYNFGVWESSGPYFFGMILFSMLRTNGKFF